MTFNNAQNVDARFGTFSEIHPGGSQTIVNINSDHHHSAVSARFDSHHRQHCLEGTRKEVLDHIDNWINARDSEAHRIYWINGFAGTGKTTIAYTIAENCQARGILGASFFCSRDDIDASNPKIIFTTIADQLGQFCMPFGNQVIRAHVADAGLKYSSVPNQLDKLLVNPLRAVRDKFPPCIIVIDALDECKDDNATSIILASLSRYIGELYPLRFLVTSRPEERISGGFRRLSGLQLTTQHFNLHEVKLDVVERDIERYLTICFNEVKQRWELDDAWPTREDVRALVRLSSGLFIFASTAIKFIQDPNESDPMVQLARLMKTTVIEDSSPYQYLDRLYMQVLTNAFPNVSENLSLRLRKVLGTIALLRYPLHPTDIEQLLHLKPGTVRNTVMQLGSVLVIPRGDKKRIHFVHPSFFDFLTDSARCTDLRFLVGSKTQHILLASECLIVMERLRRDICEIRDPSKLNSEVADLPERIDRHIPPHLQYACRNWAYHLSGCRISDAPLDLLKVFCSQSLLHWVEVCSLLGELRNAIAALDVAYKFVRTLGNSKSNLRALLDDCKRFIWEFFPVLSAASSHIYYSALPFTSTESALRKQFSHELQDSMKVYGGVVKEWDACLSTMGGHGDGILKVDISPDGVHIASGCNKGWLCLWDLMTGTHLQCLRTNSKYMRLAAFTPSGAHIASYSEGSVQLWDIASGACLSTLGQTEYIYSVVLSPDGANIATGSVDKSIRIWDSADGIHLRTLWGHANAVLAIDYSPGGIHIVSGSVDGTIRIWDATTGVQLRTLEGASEYVYTVIYSPDGTKIASRSQGVIQMWDAAIGRQLRILEMHPATPIDVVYSPDGTELALGLSDHTIQIRDANTGILLRSLNGHTDAVYSVSYSPDGMHIVSGSLDQTIRIWDAGATPNAPRDYLSRVLGLLPLPKPSTRLCETLFEIYKSKESKVILCTSRIATYSSHDKTVVLWSTKGTHLSTLKVRTGTVAGMLFSRHGAYLAVYLTDSTLHLYSGLTGAHLSSVQGDWGSIFSSTFSPDSEYFAFGSGCGTVGVWSVNGDRRVLTLQGHSDSIVEVTFFLDGAYIVSGSRDKTIRIWSTVTGAQLACFYHNADLHGIRISEDMKTIIVKSKNENDQDSFAIPQELMTSDKINTSKELLWLDTSAVHNDGWLYSQVPKRRLSWIPIRSRGSFPDDTMQYQNGPNNMPILYKGYGCLLSFCPEERTMLYISQP